MSRAADPSPSPPDPDPSSRSRLDREAVSRYARLTAAASAVGRGFQLLLSVLIVFVVLGGIAVVIGAGLEYFRKSGWTLQDVALTILGLLFLLIASLWSWVSSWPTYVWLFLIAAFFALRVLFQLEHLTQRIYKLERRVIALTKTVRKDNGGTSDDKDEW